MTNCPWCGRKPVIEHKRKAFQIGCPSAFSDDVDAVCVIAPWAEFDTREEAVATWQRADRKREHP